MSATATKPARSARNGKSPDPAPAPRVEEIPVDTIIVGPNVRQDVGELDMLASSIQDVGVLQPIRVADNGDGAFVLTFGQRRLAAAKLVGLATIPAVVDSAPAKVSERSITQLIENLQRADLGPLEEARAIRQLLDDDKTLTQDALAKRIGRSRPAVSNLLRLLNLPQTVQKAIDDGTLTASHAKAIASLPPKEAEELGKRVKGNKMSAHDLEREVQAAQQRAAAADRERDAVKAIVPKLEEKLAKQGLTKESATLVVSNDDLRNALVAAGWTVALDAPKGAAQLYGETDDCGIYRVNWMPAWGANYGPDLQALCADAAHAKARQAERERQNKEREKEWAERREEEAAARAEEEKEERAAVAELATAIAADPAKLIRLALVNASMSAYGMVDEWFHHEVFGKASHEVSTADGWARLAELPDADVHMWLARFLAEDLVESGENDERMIVNASPV